MTNINLLPWREQLRHERKKKYVYLYFGFLLAGVLLVLSVIQYNNYRIQNQQARNSYLKAEIQLLDKHNEEIQALKKRKMVLIRKMDVIQTLQQNRPVVVRFFDEMVKVLPAGIYFKKINETGEVVMIEGVAESNTYVSELMRNVENSNWLHIPQLLEIKSKDKQESPEIIFKLSFHLAKEAA